MMRPCCWHGLWWLVVLLYTPALHTSLTALNCPMLPSHNDDPPVPRWFLNGDIECFNGAHIPLGLAAIVVLIACLSLIPLTIAISLEKLKVPRWVRFLVNPLQYPYKEKYKWWSGVELTKRLVLVLSSVAFPWSDYGVIMVLMIVLTVSSFCKPYKQRVVNLLDVFLACDILVLLLLRNTAYFEDILQVIDLDITRDEVVECGSNFVSITPMVALLTPFYYIPLATALCSLLVWLGYLIYKTSKRKFKKNISKEETKGIDELSYSLPATGIANRRFTQSVVDVIELERDQSLGQSVNGLEPLKLSHKLSLQPGAEHHKKKPLAMTTSV